MKDTKKNIIRIPIRTIALALIFLITFVPILALTYYSNATITGEKQHQFEDRIQVMSSLGKQAYQSQLDRDHNIAVKMGKEPALIASMKADDHYGVKRVIDQYSVDYPFFDVITLTDSKGIVIARAASSKHGDDISTNSFIARALKGGEYSGMDIIPASSLANNGLERRAGQTNTTDGMAITNTVCIRDEYGNLLGTIITRELQNNYNGLVDSVSAGSGGSCSIYQGNIRIATSIRDTNGDRNLGTALDPEVAREVLDTGNVVEGEFVIDGIPSYAHYEPIKNAEGKTIGMIAVSYDIRPDRAAMNDLLIRSAIIGIIIAIGSMGVGYILVSNITEPIHRLVECTNSIASGNLDAHSDDNIRVKEISELTSAVNKMASNIRDRISYTESVLEGISDPLYVFGSDGTISFFNDAASKITGFSPEETKGRKCYEVIDTPACRSLRSGKKYFDACDSVKEYESPVRIKYGREVLVRGSAAALKDSEGRITGVIEIFRDITKEKEAENNLKSAQADAMEKAAFTGSILASINGIHFVVNNEGNVTYVNSIAEEVTGMSKNDILGKPCSSVFRLKEDTACRALVSGTDVKDSEDAITDARGKIIPVSINAVRMYGANKKVSGISVIARDITVQKRAQQNLGNIISAASLIARRVAESSALLNNSTNQAMMSSRQISDSIQQIAQAGQEQAHQIDGISHLTKNLSAESSSISSGATKAEAVLKDACSVARAGSDSAKHAIAKTRDLQRSVNDSAAIVRALGEKSRQIGKIVDVISTIASQTNLLALNAAIEAARAGDAGRGFAVVADEVRKLAEESARSSEQIEELLSEIRDQTGLAVASMERGTGEVASSNEVIARALRSIEDISVSIDQTMAIAHEFAATAEKQARNTAEIVKNIEQMGAIVEESASSSEEISASAEESTATMEEIARMSSDLSKIADELMSEVNRLKVE